MIKPLSPWEIVQRRMFNGQTVDASEFSRKYGLNETSIRRVFLGLDTILSPTLCSALSAETGMSEEFFHNLSEQYQCGAPSTPAAPRNLCSPPRAGFSFALWPSGTKLELFYYIIDIVTLI